MKDLMDRIAGIADRRRRYRRTVAELRAMPLDVALDLDLHPGDAERIATEAVYGPGWAPPAVPGLPRG